MYRILFKNIFILVFPIITFGSNFAFAHRKFDIKNKENIETEKIENNSVNNEIVVSSSNNIDDNLMRNFDNYPSFEESIKPDKQLENLLINTDRELKKSVFRLWETYEKEMSKQIGNERLNGSDINNTFNDSLNSLSK
tara:strand:- start:296 stop:709 length:414 start_codon:yes stop_codon:yes gene_type:complete